MDLEIKHRSGKSNANADAEPDAVETLAMTNGAIPRPDVEQMTKLTCANS